MEMFNKEATFNSDEERTGGEEAETVTSGNSFKRLLCMRT